MTMFFIRHETSYGPFFSEKQKAIDYVSGPDMYEDEPEEIPKIIEGRHSYCSIVEVELDDIKVHFDG